MGMLDNLKEMMAAQEPFNRVLRPEMHEAVKIYEDCVCYPKDQLVRLYKKEAEMRAIRDVEELKARIHEFTAVREEVEKTRFSECPERIVLWPEGNIPTETEYTENPELRYTHDPGYAPFMYEMLLPEDVAPKGAIIMSAGGDHGSNILLECYQASLEMNELGYQCFIVMNRPNANPWTGKEAGADVARAVQYVKANAAKYRVAENHVAFAGYSNGGLTGEHNIQHFSGGRTIKDAFPDYVPDELDKFSGCPDVFLCVYGPRFLGEPFDWEGVEYPPTIVIVGETDFNIPNIAPYAEDLRSHGVKVEMHTFVNCPHGGVGNAILGEVEHPNYYQWRTLCDAFMTEIYK